MYEYIKKLQAKSVPARKRILYTYMTVFMSFVFLVWIYGLGYRINHQADTVARSENEIKPLSLFKSSIVNTYENITASVGSVKSISKLMNTEEEKNELPGKQIEMIVVE